VARDSKYSERTYPSSTLPSQVPHDLSWDRTLYAAVVRQRLTAGVGRAIAQAVSPRLPTAAARIRAQAKSCGICGRQNNTGASFRRVLLFPLPIINPPTAPYAAHIIRGWYNRPHFDRRTK
jgi:hypothetical protein